MCMSRPSSMPLVLLLKLLVAASTFCVADPQHTNNWAVLVDTSRYWLNYRHAANVLALYRTVKRLGIPDSNVILMLADDYACNPRNPFKARVYNNESHELNVYGDDVEVDYRGYEVTVENFIRVLTGRHDPAVPRSKRLLSDEGSNVLIYLSGHGGDGFLKFQDMGELMSQDLADAVQQMHEKGRYHQMMVMVETCEGFTLVSRIKSRGVIAMASSIKGESALSYKNDYDIGQPVTDRFTHLTLHFFEGLGIFSRATVADLFQIYSYDMMQSHFAFRTIGIYQKLSDIPLTQFFGSVSPVNVIQEVYNYRGHPMSVACGGYASCHTNPAAFYQCQSTDNARACNATLPQQTAQAEDASSAFDAVNHDQSNMSSGQPPGTSCSPHEVCTWDLDCASSGYCCLQGPTDQLASSAAPTADCHCVSMSAKANVPHEGFDNLLAFLAGSMLILVVLLSCLVS